MSAVPSITQSPIRVGVPQKKGGSPEDARRSGDKDMSSVTHLSPPMNGKAGLFLALSPENTPDAWLDAKIEASRALPEGDMLVEIVTISPALARVMLDTCNTGNRALRQTRVAVYAAAMREGRWKLTSQGISFARDGSLNNGQHRLAAIIQADLPVKMAVVFGEDRDAFDILDTGAVRGGSDTLHVAGFKNTASMAATARQLMMIEAGLAGSNASFTNDLIRQWCEAHPELGDYLTPAVTIGKKLKVSGSGVGAAFYLIGTRSRYSQHMPRFVDRLSDGAGLGSRDILKALRDGLMTDGIVGRSHPGIRAALVAAAIVNGWNLWLQNSKAGLPKLMWNAAEPFPAVR